MGNLDLAIRHATTVKRLLDQEVARSEFRTSDSVSLKEQLQNEVYINQSKAALKASLAVIKATHKSIQKNEDAILSRNQERSAPKKVALSLLNQVSADDPAQDALTEALQDRNDFMAGEADQVQTLTDMTNAAKPAFDNFDKLLRLPYLDTFNASIDIVPVLGLKKSDEKYTIQYSRNKVSGDGIVVEWAPFSEIPSGAMVNDHSKVFIFPHLGNLMLSVDGAMWRLKHILPGDEAALNAAVGDFRKMYYGDWEKVGDDAFRSDVVNAMPYAQKTDGGEKIVTSIVVLTEDSKLFRLKGNDFEAKNEWIELRAASPSDEHMWFAGAYDVGVLSLYAKPEKTTPTGIADLYSVSVNLNANTYAVEGDGPVPDDPPVRPSSLTANEIGLVSERQPGVLYLRAVKPNPNDDEELDLVWKPWLDMDGVSHIGVASPGTMLDLNTLSHILKQRYLTVQTQIAPAVQKISSYTATDEFYLNNLLQLSKDYRAGKLPKEEIYEVAQNDITHTQVWADILSTAMGSSYEATVLMKNQLYAVNTQLKTQLVALETHLCALEATLSEKEGQLKLAQAIQLASVAAVVIGVFVLVAGVATLNPLVAVGGGLLIVAGIVGVVATSLIIKDLSEDISQLQAEINATNTAITSLSTISDTFDALEVNYSALVDFWGRSTTYAAQLSDYQDSMVMYGEAVLRETSAIEASLAVVNKLNAGAISYLDMLNAQGIIVSGFSFSDTVELNAGATAILGKSVVVGNGEQDMNHDMMFDKLVHMSGRCLQEGDRHGYFSHLNKLVKITKAQALSTTGTQSIGGRWIDISRARSAVAKMPRYHILASRTKSMVSVISPRQIHIFSAGTRAIKAAVASVKRVGNTSNVAMEGVASTARLLIKLCEGSLVWFRKFPNVTADNGAQLISLAGNAKDTCQEAQREIQRSHNLFTLTQHGLQNYQNELARTIEVQKTEMTKAKVVRDEAIKGWDDSHKLDHLGWLGGLIGGAISESLHARARNKKVQAENKNRDDILKTLNESIARMKEQMKSGVTHEGAVLTWIEMSSEISITLGHVKVLFGSLQGQLLETEAGAEDLYKELFEMQWVELKKNAEDLLSLLPKKDLPIPLAMAVSFAPAVEDRHDAMKMALMPSPGIKRSLTDMAKDSTTILRDLDVIMMVPFATDLSAYWEPGYERKSLFSMAYELRASYREVSDEQYPTIVSLNSLSLLQNIRTQNIADKTLNFKDYVVAARSIVDQVSKSVAEGAAKSKEVKGQFVAAMSALIKTVDDINQKLGSVEGGIEKVDKARRSRIVKVVANVVAILFAAGTSIGSLGIGKPYSALAASMSTAVNRGLSAAATAATIKLDAWEPCDIASLISSVKVKACELKTAKDKLTAVESLVEGVDNGIATIEKKLENMRKELSVLENRHDLESMELTKADAQEISNAWTKLQTSTSLWIDAYNKC